MSAVWLRGRGSRWARARRVGRNLPESDARFPMVLGWDVVALGSGVTDATGVTGRRLGDRVAAMVFQPLDQAGVHARHVNLEAGLLADVPPELGLPQAATVPWPV